MPHRAHERQGRALAAGHGPRRHRDAARGRARTGESQRYRRDIDREDFLAEIWKWKAEIGGTIINQLKRLGASCDWSRERFTMDEGLSKAVLKVFVDLYKQRLIYKDKRLVNWDPEFQSAVSDLEVDMVEVTGTYKWSEGEVDKEERRNRSIPGRWRRR